MHIENMCIDKVKPYLKNPRKISDNAIDKVAASINEFGFRQPIIVDKDMVIVAGHTRLLAAKKLGLAEVPVHIADNLTAKQIKAYRLADNKVAEFSKWDDGILDSELNELLDLDFDMTAFGFELPDLEVEEEEEAQVEESSEPITKNGDVWILGNHRIICGDSTDPLTVDKLLQDKKPVLMVTDPPYGVEYDPSWREGVDLGIGKRSTGKVLNDDRASWSETYSLFPGDVAYVWHSALHANTFYNDLVNCGFEVKSQIIWAKQHFALSRGDYHWQHEPCWYAIRKGKKHNWQGKRDQSTVWEIDNANSFGGGSAAVEEEQVGHGTQKPIECMLRPILNSSKKGDIIYEPFSGSGTTIIAAEKSDRICYAIELSEGYVDAAVKRWEKVTGREAILESTGETFKMVADRFSLAGRLEAS